MHFFGADRPTLFANGYVNDFHAKSLPKRISEQIRRRRENGALKPIEGVILPDILSHTTGDFEPGSQNTEGFICDELRMGLFYFDL